MGNGRVYDPVLGMFIIPDPYIQDPEYSVNFNRYAYALNNPLKYTDPGGEFIFTLLCTIIPGAQFLLPVAISTDIGWMTGGMRAVSQGKSFWSGAWKGGVVGAIGGLMAPIGGGTFFQNVLWGATEGAIIGGLDAALWGNDIGQGIMYGALFGGGIAAIQSGYQIINNGTDYGYWNTNDVAFEKMVNRSTYTVNGQTLVDKDMAQRALDFWTDRFGGPSLTYYHENAGWEVGGRFFHQYSSPSTAINGTIKIPSHKFILGADYVKRSIAHETGHYLYNIPWTNKPGGPITGNRWINIDRTRYGGDGIYGYHNAIKNAGRFHIGYDAIAIASDTRWGHQAWIDFNLLKWLYLIPRRF